MCSQEVPDHVFPVLVTLDIILKKKKKSLLVPPLPYMGVIAVLTSVTVSIPSGNAPQELVRVSDAQETFNT